MVSFGDLNPIKAASKAVDAAQNLGGKAVDALQGAPAAARGFWDDATDALGDAASGVADAAGGAKEAVEDFGTDVLVEASAIGAKAKLPFGQWIEHPLLSPGERQELQGLARSQAQREPKLPTWGEAVNAHHTNTPDELRQAAQGNFDCYEVDIRVMKGFDGKPTPVAAHDEGNLKGVTMDEWFAIAGASGRYLKLDFKEPEALPAVMALAKKHQIPAERLVFNLSANPTALEAVRKAFPEATLAIGAPADGQRQQEIAALAQRLGPPVTFVMQRDDITPEAVANLEGVGPISAWGSKGSREEREAIATRLREMGVTGMIDLGLQGGP